MMNRLSSLAAVTLVAIACSSNDSEPADGGSDVSTPNDSGADTFTAPKDSAADTSPNADSGPDALDAADGSSATLGQPCTNDSSCAPAEACPAIFETNNEVCKAVAASAVNGCGASPPTVTIAPNQIVYVHNDFGAGATRTEHLNGSCTDPTSLHVDQVFVLHVTQSGTLGFWSGDASIGFGQGTSCPGDCVMEGAFSVNTSRPVTAGDYYVTLFGYSPNVGHIELRLQ